MVVVRPDTIAFGAGAIALVAACIVPFTGACLAACGIALSVGEVLHGRRRAHTG
jgi:hypothetical protein